MSYAVTVLKAGYAEWQGASQQRADGTITLVTGKLKVLIDTGGPQNRHKISSLLAQHGLTCGDIDYVVCTHGHADHVGNINLFDNATLIMASDSFKGEQFTLLNLNSGQPHYLDDDLYVLATPGHTHDSNSVIVKTKQGVYAVTGDLFERQEDLEDAGLWQAFSDDREAQETNRRVILELADYIVPGHGDMFALTKHAQARSLAAVQSEISGEELEKARKLALRRRLSIVTWRVVVPFALAVLSGILVYSLTQ